MINIFAQLMHRDPHDMLKYWLVLSCCQSSITLGLTVSASIMKGVHLTRGSYTLSVDDKIKSH